MLQVQFFSSRSGALECWKVMVRARLHGAGCYLHPVAILLVALPVVILAQQGCGMPSPYTLGQSDSDSISVGGLNRTFHIYVPSGYTGDEPRPILMFFHGGGGTGKFSEQVYGIDELTEPNNFIAVYPNGVLNTWNAGDCCGPAKTLNIDDVGFVSQLLDYLNTSLCLDATRYS